DAGLVSTAAVDRWADAHADEVGPIHGAVAVAHRWTTGPKPPPETIGTCGCGRRWRLVDNGSARHHVVLPAGRSCTGWPVLGVPPSWWRRELADDKDLRAYLARERGLELDRSTELAVLVDDRSTHHLV